MKKTQKIVIGLVLVVTLASRLLFLDGIPVHLSNDEISIAYDAYSIVNTLRDEHNNFLPIAFQSHGTYKAPLYIYLASVTNYFLGNSEYSVRLPSAIAGVLTVIIFGLLIWLLSNNINLGIIGSALLAITPWHIYTSRMALETSVAFFFLMLGITTLFLTLRVKKKHWFLVAMIFMALSVWAYHTEWVLTPMIIVGFSLIYFGKIRNSKSYWVGMVVFLVLITPIVINAWNERNTNARANTEIITKDIGVAKVLQNPSENVIRKTMVIGKAFVSNYSEYVRLGYLFFDGLSLLPKEDPFTTGLFLVPFLPVFIWGSVRIKKYFPKNYIFIYFWLLVSPVVPSLTHGGVNLVRNLASVAPYTLAISCGLVDLSMILTKKYWKIGFGMALLIASCYFLVIYYYHFPFQSGENFQYGYKQAAEFINNNYSKYDQIVVEPRFGKTNVYVGVPHLYLAYFTNLDPNKILQRQDTSKGTFFDKYQIREINWNLEIVKPKTLYLVPFDNMPDGEKLKQLYTAKEIKLPNYKVEFRLMESL